MEALITCSPINCERLKGQNKRLYDYLMDGNSIHVFHPAKSALKIGYLNSRASDLINVHHIIINKRRIKVKDALGESVDVTEYSIKPFEDNS